MIGDSPYYRIGPVAEGLGKGLQNLVQRFNSAPDLIILKKFKHLKITKKTFHAKQKFYF